MVLGSAEIFAADLFQTAFAADPLSREAWQRFRSVILEPGGSKDGLSMMTEFLGGRQCEARALLDMLGVSAGG